MNDSIYDWTIDTIPTHKNEVKRWIKIMNKWGHFPFPMDRPANYAKKRIKLLLPKVKEIEFQFDFSMIYGNLEGESIWFGGRNVQILDYAPIYFGSAVNCGPDIKLITSWHPYENFNQVKAAPIILEDNVWLTMNIIVLPGVTIGKNSVIGAGSVVTKSIPANVLAAGNPAKVIKVINREKEWWKEVK